VTLGSGGHWLAPLCALAAWTIGADLAPSGATSRVRLPDGDPTDLQRSVLSQPDDVVSPAPTDVGDPRIVVPAKSRVLSILPLADEKGVAVLLATLHAGGSLVLVTNAAPDRLAGRAATERATHTAGADVPGLPLVG
jgi:hypothetical protein